MSIATDNIGVVCPEQPSLCDFDVILDWLQVRQDRGMLPATILLGLQPSDGALVLVSVHGCEAGAGFDPLHAHK